MPTPRDLAIQRDLIPQESRHVTENSQQSYHVFHFGSFCDVSVPINVMLSMVHQETLGLQGGKTALRGARVKGPRASAPPLVLWWPFCMVAERLELWEGGGSHGP